MDEVDGRRLRRAGGPVEIEPFGHDEHRQRAGIAARLRRLAHDGLEAGGRLRIGVGRAPVLGDAERLERAQEIRILLARHDADEASEEELGGEGVGTGERRPQQSQEAVEKPVVLDQVAGHHRIGHGSGKQFLDEAMPDSLRPAGLARGAQGFGEAFRHGGGSQLSLDQRITPRPSQKRVAGWPGSEPLASAVRRSRL